MTCHDNLGIKSFNLGISPARLHGLLGGIARILMWTAMSISNTWGSHDKVLTTWVFLLAHILMGP